MRITILNGPQEGITATVEEDQLIVGRCESCKLSVEDRRMSREHFLVLGGGGYWGIADLHSTNGTQVNGRPVNVCSLQNGDMITAGRTDFRVQFGPAPSAKHAGKQEGLVNIAALVSRRQKFQK